MSAANIAEPLQDETDFTRYRPHPPAPLLAQWLQDAHAMTRSLWRHIDGERLQVPLLPIVNPPLWELGHIAHFHEFWLHRGGDTREPSLIDGADKLYDSARVAHDSRWHLPLPDLDATWRYFDTVHARTLDTLKGDLTDERAYFVQLCVLHHDMHNEAFAYMWHTLGYPAPLPLAPMVCHEAGDIEFDDGKVQLGSRPRSGFVFDNEKWAHEVTVPAFALSRRPVTNGEFLAFVEDGGAVPRYWRKQEGQWLLRRYDRWLPLPADEPVMHVSWNEAQAYCRWAGRRLPTEAEWQRAAPHIRHGQVWEWTESRFLPFSGFSADPYREYSAPWFADDHRVLRGGSFASSPRLARPAFRNFFKPERADVFCGFRTCAKRNDT